MFRKAKKSDILGIIRVMKDTGYSDLCYKGKTTTEIKNCIEEDFKKRTYLVAHNKNKILGYFIIGSAKTNGIKEARNFIKINDNYAYHCGIGIHSKHRKKGIGFKFTEYACKLAKNKGYKGIYADVSSANLASIKLQEKSGFKKQIEHKSKKRYPANNIVFLKKL